MDSNNDIAILYDLDGVVMDTEPQYTKFWEEQGRKYLPDNPDFIHRIKGSTLAQIYDKYFHGMTEEQRQITSDLHKMEDKMTFDYIPGAEDFMKEARRAGIPSALVTSSTRDKLENVIKAHPELKTYVDHIITAEDITHSKPHPECYTAGAASCNKRPSSCIAFEDSYNGLLSARTAGCYVVGMATTFSAQDIQNLSNIVVHNFEDLNPEQIIESYNISRN